MTALPYHELAQREGDRVGRLKGCAWQPRAYVSLLDIAILGDPVLTHVAPDYLRVRGRYLFSPNEPAVAQDKG